MRVGNTEVVRSFLVLLLAVAMFPVWVQSTLGGALGHNGSKLVEDSAFSPLAVLLMTAVPLLVLGLAAAMFRHYGHIGPFAAKNYARALLIGAMMLSLVASALPLVRAVHWMS